MLLVTDFERGGTPLRIARLARWLRDAGAEVCAGCLARPGPVSAELAAAGIATFSCGAVNRYDLRALWRLSRHVRRTRPHLIHSSLMHANVAARLVGRWHDVAVVSSTATIEVERRWHRWVERNTAWMDSGHIVNSVALAEHVVRALGMSRERVYVVPPSLDALPQRIERGAARAALYISAEEFVVAWVGRFDPVKRLDIIVRCAALLTSVPVRFLLAGDGPERRRIERLVQDSAAGRRVQLLGWCADVVPILSASDAFLFPSLTEGMPNAVLEALAWGLPIVASDIPALRELAGAGPFTDDGAGARVSDQSPSGSAGPADRSPSGSEGSADRSPQRQPRGCAVDSSGPGPARERPVAAERMLLAVGDRPQDFAAALLRLRDDPALARALGERGAAWAREHLRPQATVEAVLRAYRDVLQSRPPFAVKSRRGAS